MWGWIVFWTVYIIFMGWLLFWAFVRLPWVKKNFKRYTNQTSLYLKTLMELPGGLQSFYPGMIDEYFDNLPEDAWDKAMRRIWVWDLREFVKDKEMYDRVMGSELK